MSYEIIKGIVLEQESNGLKLTELNTLPEYGLKEVKLLASALNHRDLWITKGMYPNIVNNVILGSDGVGLWGEEKVIIYPGLNWGENPKVQSDDFSVLGMPSNGTFSDKLFTDKEKVFPKPGHLSDYEAAALPLAGLTAFRTLFKRCKLNNSDDVLINGVGGGVATMAMLFAIANGNKVYVTSSSEEKIEMAIGLGAVGGYNYKEEKWHKKLLSEIGGVDVVIDSAGGPGFSNLVKITNPGGRIGFFGGSANWENLNPRIMFWRQISLMGSTMGSLEDFGEMLEFVSKYQIKPIVDSVFKIKDYRHAFERMAKGEQFGKIVLDNSGM